MYRKRTDNILTAVFGIIICVSIALIIRDLMNYKKADREYDRLKDYMSVSTETVRTEKNDSAISGGATEQKTSDFDSLYRINNDLVCILSIPSLDLEYPVVQCSDNEKYLDMTFEGNKNPSGCLFIDHENNKEMTDPNTVIYGHNMKDGSMFGRLKKIVRKETDEQEIKAYIETENKRYSYTLSKAEVVDINDYSPPENVKNLLTLYTCWGNDKNKRLLVTFSRDV